MIVGYLLANRHGELLVTAAQVEEAVARDLLTAGWAVYRRILAG